MNHWPPKKILVAVDSSRQSQNAWRWSRALASRLGAALKGIYVHQTIVWPGVDYLAEVEWRKAKSTIVRRIKSFLGRGRLAVGNGHPPTSIIQAAHRFKADLIVMGTHGRRGLEHAVLGSVVESVIRYSPAPVLTVKIKPAHVRSILVPVNFTPYAQAALEAAARLAKAMRARLVLLHVVPSLKKVAFLSDEFKDMISRLPADVRPEAPIATLVRQGKSPVRVIVAESQKHQLVVMAAHKKFVLKDFVLGMTVQQVLRLSKAPVLALPAPRAAGAGRRLKNRRLNLADHWEGRAFVNVS
ncbi:MAG: universal stress protein [Elusimicrobia bacterium]|nr:universal stress protein [Elusimicrobiota bacterium]